MTQRVWVRDSWPHDQIEIAFVEKLDNVIYLIDPCSGEKEQLPEGIA